MSSDAAFVGDAGLADYATAKMGLIGFTRALARELAADGVTVNAVAPARSAPARMSASPQRSLSGFARIRRQALSPNRKTSRDWSPFCQPRSALRDRPNPLIDGGRWMV